MRIRGSVVRKMKCAIRKQTDGQRFFDWKTDKAFDWHYF